MGCMWLVAQRKTVSVDHEAYRLGYTRGRTADIFEVSGEVFVEARFGGEVLSYVGVEGVGLSVVLSRVRISGRDV